MSLAAPSLAEVGDAELDRKIAARWRAGNLRWKLHSAQQEIYDKYRAWELTRANDEKNPRPGSYPRVFVFAKSGRFGGSTLALAIKTEDCIRNPGQMHRISSAFAKNINEIVNDVSFQVFDDAPPDVRPVYKGSQGPQGPGFYFPLQPGFRRQSVIRLVGLDLNPNGTRGQASDGDIITEAGFVKGLEHVVKSVLYRQYQGRPHASLILESSAPDIIDTDWERIFLPDAQMRDAYVSKTIEDNPLLTPHEVDVFCAAMGGREHPDCQREYFNVIAVNPKDRVVPEFDEKKHVQEWPRPDYAHCYVSADPGSRDLFGLTFAHWNWSRAALYFEFDWAEFNALTMHVAEAVRIAEKLLWGAQHQAEKLYDRMALPGTRAPGIGADMPIVKAWHPAAPPPPEVLTYYDPLENRLRANPYMRVTDIDRRLAGDLAAEYGLDFHPADKTDSAEARVNAYRDAVAGGKVIFHPRCKKLIAHHKAAKWNKHRTDWDRTSVHGHFDLLATAIQLWRIVAQNRHISPNPPQRPSVAPGVEVVDSLPWQRAANAESLQHDVMAELMGRGRRTGAVRVPRE